MGSEYFASIGAVKVFNKEVLLGFANCEKLKLSAFLSPADKVHRAVMHFGSLDSSP